MYKCWNCEAIFEEPVYKEFWEHYEAWGRNFTEKHTEVFCPRCGDEEFEEYYELEEEEEDEFEEYYELEEEEEDEFV